MAVGEWKLPKYFNVDDTPVVLEQDGDKVVGKIANGNPYPPVKAFVAGYEITKAEFDRLKKELYG